MKGIATGVLTHIEFAKQNGAMRFEIGDHGGVIIRHKIFQDGRAIGGAYAFGVNLVLDSDWNAVHGGRRAGRVTRVPAATHRAGIRVSNDLLPPQAREERVSRALMVAVSLVLIAGGIVFGLLIVGGFTTSLQPELERRADLIGETIRADTERAVGIGIPLSELVGVDDYFGGIPL